MTESKGRPLSTGGEGMTGEATDLVARLRLRQRACTYKNASLHNQERAAEYEAAATLIEAQAAEIEGLTLQARQMADALLLLDRERKREGVRFVHLQRAVAAAAGSARAFLASRTKRAAIETTRVGSTLSAAERTSPHFR